VRGVEAARWCLGSAALTSATTAVRVTAYKLSLDLLSCSCSLLQLSCLLLHHFLDSSRRRNYEFARDR
jgi:hypothetical protein